MSLDKIESPILQSPSFRVSTIQQTAKGWTILNVFYEVKFTSNKAKKLKVKGYKANKRLSCKTRLCRPRSSWKVSVLWPRNNWVHVLWSIQDYWRQTFWLAGIRVKVWNGTVSRLRSKLVCRLQGGSWRTSLARWVSAPVLCKGRSPSSADHVGLHQGHCNARIENDKI